MKNKFPIYRITVDECLSEDLVRVLFAELKVVKDESFFDDTVNTWKEEKVLLVNHETWIEALSVPVSYTEKYPFSTLREGQVFLCGNITLNKSKNSKKRFKTNKSPARKLLHVTSYVKEDIKKLYTKALMRGEVNNGRKKNKTR